MKHRAPLSTYLLLAFSCLDGGPDVFGRSSYSPRDSNPDAFRPRILSPLRLPVSPEEHVALQRFTILGTHNVGLTLGQGAVCSFRCCARPVHPVREAGRPLPHQLLRTEGETRTLTLFRAHGPKPCVSAKIPPLQHVRAFHPRGIIKSMSSKINWFSR